MPAVPVKSYDRHILSNFNTKSATFFLKGRNYTKSSKLEWYPPYLNICTEWMKTAANIKWTKKYEKHELALSE